MSFMDRFFGPQAQMKRLDAMHTRFAENRDGTQLAIGALRMQLKTKYPLVEQTALQTLDRCVDAGIDGTGISRIVRIDKKGDTAKLLLAKMLGRCSQWKTLKVALESDERVRNAIESLAPVITREFSEWRRIQGLIDSPDHSTTTPELKRLFEAGAIYGEYARRLAFSALVDRSDDKTEMAGVHISDRDDMIAGKSVMILLDDKFSWPTLANALENDRVRGMVDFLDPAMFSAPFLRWLATSQEIKAPIRAYAIDRLERGQVNGGILEELLADSDQEIAIRALMCIINRGKLSELAPAKAANAVAHMLNNESEWETLAPILESDRRLRELVANMEYGNISGFLFWLMRSKMASLRNLCADINAQIDAAVLYKPAFEICGATREQRYGARVKLVMAALKSESVATMLVGRVAELATVFEGAENIGEQLWATEVASDFASIGLIVANDIVGSVLTEMHEILDDGTDGTLRKMAVLVIRRMNCLRNAEGGIEFRIEPKAYSYEDAVKTVGLN